MNDQEQTMVNHLADLDRKLRTSQFNIDQLNVGREAFVNMLAASLEAPEEPAAAE